MSALTALGLPYPQSTDDVRPHEDIQALAEAMEALLALPDEVTATGLATHTVTSTTGTNLPTASVSVTITNPSADLDLIWDLTLGCWGQSTSGNLRCYLAASGGITFDIPPGGIGPLNYGEIIQFPASSLQHSGFIAHPVVMPAGAADANIAVHAMRTIASGTQQINYPVLRARPRRFVAP